MILNNEQNNTILCYLEDIDGGILCKKCDKEFFLSTMDEVSVSCFEGTIEEISEELGVKFSEKNISTIPNYL